MAALHKWLIPGLLLFAVFACRPEPAGSDDERKKAITTVDGYTISVRDFEASYVNFLIRTGQNDTPTNRYLHLAGMTDAALLADEADRRGYGTDPQFQESLERTRRQAIGGRFFETAFLETLPPLEDAEIRNAYLRSKQQVVVRHLFYRNPVDADSAYARLEAGRSFLEEAVDCYNLTAIDSTAGYLGPIRYFQVDDAFAEAAFALDVGEYSKPVRSRFGFHIIRAEEKYAPTILAESEFQTRREGMKTQLALRTRRLEGDRFVRGFMEGLEVQVDADGIRMLAQTIQDITYEANPTRTEVKLNAEEVRELRATLQPDTPLATYTLNGEPLTFTAADYFLWLPELPFAEARGRTAASVGRALRNEALYRAGQARGLDTDPQVLADMDRGRRWELTVRLRDSLHTMPPEAIPEPYLRSAFAKSPLARQQSWTADFWTITFDTQADAETAQAKLTQDPAQAAAYPNFSRYTAQDLQVVPEWSGTVRQAPMQRVNLARQASDTWALVYVEQRTVETPPFEALRDTLAEALAPRYTEFQLLQRLYDQAAVATDTLLFEQIMRLNDE